ncbi:cbb3-type cytochrome c oxidase subunit I [Shigella flexneri]
MMMYMNLIQAWGGPGSVPPGPAGVGVFSEIAASSGVNICWVTPFWCGNRCCTVLSFIVWLHHFLPWVRRERKHLPGITTMIIAIPTGFKIFNWLFAIYKGRLQFHSAMLSSCGFIVAFSVGGITGVLLAVRVLTCSATVCS